MKLLLPLAWLYACVVALRNKAFDWRLLRSESVGTPVISIGNITVGGTGKTPLVEYVVRELTRRGKKVAVVSRGYGRISHGVAVVSDGMSLRANARSGGDEPVQIAMKIPEAIVVVGEKRVDAARTAVKLGAQVLVMDDGFQHRYLKRDLDIVVIDVLNNDSTGSLLPVGRAREPWSCLKRANVVAFSKIPDEKTLEVWKSRVSRWHKGPNVGFRLTTTGIRKALGNSNIPFETFAGERAIAFSGIGNHGDFLKSLREKRVEIAGEMRFPDHHMYSADDLSTIKALKKRVGCRFCITTEKDAVRLRADSPLYSEFADSLSLHFTTVEVEFVEGEPNFLEIIQNAAASDSLAGE